MSRIDDLERLQKLRESGTITEQEFEIEKKKILNENIEVELKQQIPTNNKICKRCGNELSEGEKFCGKCGAGINDNTNNVSGGIWNINKWTKVLKISMIASIILTIMTLTTNMMNIRVIWNICKVFCYMSYYITVIAFLGCTIISIVRKKRLPLWINVIQGIVVAAIIITIMVKISDSNYEKNREKAKNEISIPSIQPSDQSSTQPKDSNITNAIKEFADKIRSEQNGSAKYSTYYKYKTTSSGEQVYKIKYLTSLDSMYFYQLVSLDSNNEKVVKYSRLFTYSDYNINESLELEYAYEEIWGE